jgi:drug/metabolite transporter (DMT)-like permease
MTRRDTAELLLLGALWGSSFLFMRVAAPEFGPLALVLVRVGGAAAVLLPLLAWQGQWRALRKHWRTILVVGVLNSAVPFALFALAALSLTTALMSVFNATAAIWGALIAWAWLRDRLEPSRWLGMAIGVAGVLALSWGKADLRPGEHGVSAALGIAACLGAAVLYGLAGAVSRRHLAGVPPLTVAAGSQAGATLVLLVPALWAWPTATPSPGAWGAAVALALLCTGLAYLLYFRLIAHTGVAQAMSVTFLIPLFALAWGWAVLGEVPTPGMVAGCAVILLGTAMATGMLKWPLRSPAN